MSIIAGYAQHGFASRSLELYEQMQKEGLTADHLTFTAVFSACGHAGLVDEEQPYFNSMNHDHGTGPNMEHSACMVDLLGHAKQLDEAW
jgi:pentatricopeptide repeat protein